VSDFRIHSFVIKLWLESSVGATKRAVWRGRISHIPGNEYLYLKKLDDIPLFIMPYLEEMGVELEASWRIRRWLQQFHV
jgi:hypothetical protein